MTEFFDQPSADVVSSGDDVLPADPGSAPRPRPRGRLLAIGAGVVAVVVVAAGGVAVGMSLSGGGGQPEDLVPASAVAYADLDLDPSAAQKIDAVRFFRHFPSADSALGTGDDLRQFVAKAFTNSSIDYAADVEPWLGRRYGVALIPGTSGQPPTVEGVLQVTDEAAARRDLPKLFPSGTSYTVSDGFAVIASPQSSDRAPSDSAGQSPSAPSAQALVDQAHSASLADSSAFTTAMSAYPDGVATFYVDVPKLDQVLQSAVPGAGSALSTSPLSPQQLTGVVAGVVRFEPDALELLASGPTAAQSAPLTMVSRLPRTTAAVIAVSGYGDAFKKAWGPLMKQMSGVSGSRPGQAEAQLEKVSGLSLPEDLVALLGSQLSLSVDSQGLAGFPLFGYQAKTDPAAAAHGMAAVTTLLQKAGVSVTSKTTPDGIVLASTPGYADTLAAADGTLGSSPAFTAAVPDAAGATQVLYLDLAAIFGATGVASGASGKDLAPLSSVGASVHVDGGQATYRLRLSLSSG